MLTNVPNHIKTIDINIKFGELGEIIRWCQHNTSDDWWYEMGDPAGAYPGNYRFYFDNEKDYVNFLLWKT